MTLSISSSTGFRPVAKLRQLKESSVGAYMVQGYLKENQLHYILAAKEGETLERGLLGTHLPNFYTLRYLNVK